MNRYRIELNFKGFTFQEGVPTSELIVAPSVGDEQQISLIGRHQVHSVWLLNIAPETDCQADSGLENIYQNRLSPGRSNQR